MQDDYQYVSQISVNQSSRNQQVLNSLNILFGIYTVLSKKKPKNYRLFEVLARIPSGTFKQKCRLFAKCTRFSVKSKTLILTLPKKNFSFSPFKATELNEKLP